MSGEATGPKRSGGSAEDGGEKVGASGIPATGRVLLIWTLASLVVGGIGGLVGEPFGAPYYFGFFLGFVLTGLAGLFALADHVSRKQNGGM